MKFVVIHQPTDRVAAEVYNREKAERLAAAWSAGHPDNNPLVIAREYESGPKRGQRVTLATYQNGAPTNV